MTSNILEGFVTAIMEPVEKAGARHRAAYVNRVTLTKATQEDWRNSPEFRAWRTEARQILNGRTQSDGEG